MFWIWELGSLASTSMRRMHFRKKEGGSRCLSKSSFAFCKSDRFSACLSLGFCIVWYNVLRSSNDSISLEIEKLNIWNCSALRRPETLSRYMDLKLEVHFSRREIVSQKVLGLFFCSLEEGQNCGERGLEKGEEANSG